ncbi:MAG: hypothetical protein HOM58_13015 [Rhodospirillaceae bacterium]|jgi:endonuclease YncB( thermonuclease family)|nr:hypothetical protein [Rhodospirillaceae bacterium]
MRKLTTIICLTIAVLFGGAGVSASASADYQKGWTAANSGDFATALREWTPLAKQGDTRAQTELYGPVTHVRDGDTIKIGPIAVRLEGVSAPELREKLGQQSKIFMRNLVIGKIVLCRLNGSKTYDRFVGVCFLDNKDIGATIIAKGLARDCPRYSGGRYKKLQTASAKRMIKLPKYCRRKTYR